MKKPLAILTTLLLATGIVTACSGEAEESEEVMVEEESIEVKDTKEKENTEEREEIEKSEAEDFLAERGALDRFATDDVEELLRAEPGEYDVETEQEEIMSGIKEAIAAGVEGDDLFHVLLDLGAADFREYQKYLDEVEVVFSDITTRPDGSSEEERAAKEMELNVQILFDASSSMAAEVADGVKMDLAKDAVREFVSDMPKEANVSLRVYGHVSSNQEESCSMTEAVYPLGPYEEAAFADALDEFEPTGYTPIALAMEEAMDNLAAVDGEYTQNIVYIVSDGQETCGGDPLQAAQELHNSDIEAIVNIIGFDVKADEQQALMDIAEAGNGEYLAVQDGEELQRALMAERLEMVTAWSNWMSENVHTAAVERNEYVGEAFGHEVNSINDMATERDNFIAMISELREHTEMTKEEVDQLFDKVQERARLVGDHFTNEMKAIKDQAMEEGNNIIDDVSEEAENEKKDSLEGLKEE
ncbi:VWA domain-containing protein [Gracilibacillus alcaliphilus]|uniref:VWA domain-containing protein n=1 Tax=Gracilibacillus alcaliphilus TaxID=1401441 RepID=UPI0019583693|nr:VWA domain-containing protein [Gracilibacillus alcaliphilus]MBM7676722.1 D-amino-acid dehydrogenase/Ca-activated chloride channel family protein [Gracilibacillus alcaliphilus]